MTLKGTEVEGYIGETVRVWGLVVRWSGTGTPRSVPVPRRLSFPAFSINSPWFLVLFQASSFGISR